MSEMEHSPAVQDYLRAIFQLGEQKGSEQRITTTQLAERLGVRPASVTAMLQRLATASPALIDYHKSHGAQLTEAGQLAALQMVRAHRLLELYLYEVLGYSWDEVHEEADRLEHVVSKAMLNKVAETLGHPTHDPHGHAIPAADLSVEAPARRKLAHLIQGGHSIILHVRDDDPAILRYCAEVGLRPGATVLMVEPSRSDGSLCVKIDDRAPVWISPDTADNVFVIERASS